MEVAMMDTATMDTTNKIESFRMFTGISAGYAVFYTFCRYRNPSGITYPFLIGATLYLFHWLLDRSGKKLQRGSRFYEAALLLLGFSKCSTANRVILALDGVAIFLVLGILLIRNFLPLQGRELTPAGFLGKLMAIVWEPFLLIGRPFSDGYCFLRHRGDGQQKQSKGIVRDILIGVLIAIPLLIVVTVILSGADVVFRNLVDGLLDSFTWPKHISDLLAIPAMAVCVFLAVYCLSCFLTKQHEEKAAAEKKQASAVIAVTVTGLLTAVYLLFCGIQVLYLFDRNLALPEGYTYSAYVHEGFNQLIAVCLLNLVIIAVSQSHFGSSKVLRVLLTVFCGCTYMMTVSAAIRIALYVRAYHLTFDRILVIWTILAIACCLTVLLLRLYLQKLPAYTCCAAVITVLYLALALSHPDYLIARYNMNWLQSEETEYDSDRSYLMNLSADAYPALVQDKILREELLDRAEEVKKYRAEEKLQSLAEQIRTCNLSEETAQLLLQQDR